jgi:hypothetical protein
MARAKRVQVAAHELDAAFIRDATVIVGAIEIGTAILSDFEGRAFVLASDTHE